VAQACRAFNIPVTGGNVSFYNDTEGISIYPSPVLGVVGIVDDVSKAVSPGFKRDGDSVILLGVNKEELGGSEYLKRIYSMEKGIPPQIDFEEEKRIQKFCLEAISKGLVESAHDVSEGGLAVSLAECSLLSPQKIGFSLVLQDDMRRDALLFGETQSRIVVSSSSQKLKKLLKLAKKREVKATVLGKTDGDRIIIYHHDKKIIDLPVDAAYKAWKEAIPDIFRIK
jgi:phosphoribosylformylglycinamidine synthase